MNKVHNSWLDTMNGLKEKHSIIAELIGGNSVAFLDIPTYFNVGDLLIWKGTEQFFKEHNVNIVYRSDCNKINHKELEKADIILFQGGGNFGDLYHSHQNLREIIVRKYKSKRIICLPQTIKFESMYSEKKSASVFKEHNDFHILTRDIHSFETSKKFTSNVMLVPDMAHSLHPMVDVSEITTDQHLPKILNMVRVDIESMGATANERLSKRGFDWINIISQQDYWLQSIYKKASTLSPHSASMNNRCMSFWGRCSDNLVFRSVNYFNNHTEVHTDRLHGLILASLLGKKVNLFDNSYGKNSSYYKMWLSTNPLISF
ncbi:polysaccharide pyruvyl transferase family protein [Vibrio owensii]|uniref:polysaccharide pyruvyl transferase family protein n=1 Tax=Vibrio owensii TaxID=696485 RepID=UPI0018F1CC1C|nr:polysaccharide pyruvyl transferase family protein [Vibrio owensii]